MEPVIQVQQLCKSFHVRPPARGLLPTVRSMFTTATREIRAIDNITFAVGRGELLGYLGPNGAGKSTTIKILTGLLVPTAGVVRVNGFVPWRSRTQYVNTIGAVFGQRTTLWWDLPVIETMQLLRHIYRIPAARFHRNLAKFRALLDLDEFIDAPVRSLSLGQRMRADLCAAMLHEPDLLFLDEPTIGLDVVAKERIRNFILEINRDRQTTILLTTHDLRDIERLCRRILIIDRGRLLYDGSLAHLQDRFGGARQLLVDFAEEYENPQIADAELIEHLGPRVIYAFDRSRISASELIGRIAATYRVHDLSVREPDVEETIRRIYAENLLESHASSSHTPPEEKP